MEDDLPIIWNYLETKIAPYITNPFSRVQDSSSVSQQSADSIQQSVWDILRDLKQSLSKEEVLNKLIVNFSNLTRHLYSYYLRL